MCSNNDNSVTDLNGILTTGDADMAVTVKAADQKIFAEIQVCKRNICHLGFFANGEFQGFCVAVQYMIKSFHIASDTVLCGTDILQDIISGDVLGINNASDIKRINDIIEFQTVDLGNQFGIGDTFGKKGKENILLIQIGKGNKRFGFCKSFFKKKRTVRSVTVDNGCIRKQLA